MILLLENIDDILLEMYLNNVIYSFLMFELC